MADAHAKHHEYHLVDPSPWPIIGAVSSLALTMGGVYWMRGGTSLIAIAGILGIIYVMIAWWRDIINEAEHKGDHTAVVQLHLRYGMILFIASEVMFFVAWFWAYFDVALFPGSHADFSRTELLGGPVDVAAKYPGTGDNTRRHKCSLRPGSIRRASRTLADERHPLHCMDFTLRHPPLHGMDHRLRRGHTRPNQRLERDSKRQRRCHLDGRRRPCGR